MGLKTPPPALEEGTTENKIRRYQAFIQDRLQPDLLLLRGVREQIAAKLQQYEALQKNIEAIQTAKLSKIQTKVNLGCNVYMQAVVDDPNMIFVDIGLGFHAEFTFPEALAFIAIKTKNLKTKWKKCNKESADIGSRIKMVYETIGNLMKLEETIPTKKERKFL